MQSHKDPLMVLSNSIWAGWARDHPDPVSEWTDERLGGIFALHSGKGAPCNCMALRAGFCMVWSKLSPNYALPNTLTVNNKSIQPEKEIFTCLRSLGKSTWLYVLWFKAGSKFCSLFRGGGATSCPLMASASSSSHYFTKTHELGYPAFICAKYKWKNKLNAER